MSEAPERPKRDIGDCIASGQGHNFLACGPNYETQCEYCGCDALDLYERAFEAMFGQACSNGLFDAWGRPIDCSLLNEAHALAQTGCANFKRIEGAGNG